MNDDLLSKQAKQLKELLDEIATCCQIHRHYEVNKFSLPYAEANCLLAINQQNGCSLKKIAQQLEVSKSRVTRIIQSLAKKGLVTINAHPQDSRNKLCELSAEGYELIQKLEAFRFSLHLNVLKQINAEDREEVLNSLQKLKQAISKVDKPKLFSNLSKSDKI